MRDVCAWCQAETRRPPVTHPREEHNNHGICETCCLDFQDRVGMDLLALIEELPYGAIAVDTDLRVRGANQQACDLFQDEWVSLLGRPLGTAFGCEHPMQNDEDLEQPACPGCEVHRLVRRSFSTGRGGVTVMARRTGGHAALAEPTTHRVTTFKVGELVGLRFDPIQGAVGVPF